MPGPRRFCSRRRHRHTEGEERHRKLLRGPGQKQATDDRGVTVVEDWGASRSSVAVCDWHTRWSWWAWESILRPPCALAPKVATLTALSAAPDNMGHPFPLGDDNLPLTLDEPPERPVSRWTLWMDSSPSVNGVFLTPQGWGQQFLSWADACLVLWRAASDGGVTPLIGEIFGHNRLRSRCLQLQPVTCSHPPVFLY